MKAIIWLKWNLVILSGQEIGSQYECLSIFLFPFYFLSCFNLLFPLCQILFFQPLYSCLMVLFNSSLSSLLLILSFFTPSFSVFFHCFFCSCSLLAPLHHDRFSALPPFTHSTIYLLSFYFHFSFSVSFYLLLSTYVFFSTNVIPSSLPIFLFLLLLLLFPN